MTSLIGLLVTLAAWFPFLVTISVISFNAHHGNVSAGGPLQLVDTDTVSITQGQVRKKAS